tara:strand:- start:2041 stop:2340 length:300 start_codon:yes stop_codon:yes gene_type:complete
LSATACPIPFATDLERTTATTNIPIAGHSETQSTPNIDPKRKKKAGSATPEIRSVNSRTDLRRIVVLISHAPARKPTNRAGMLNTRHSEATTKDTLVDR